MSGVDNEEGIAYALISVVAFVIMGALIVIVLTPGVAITTVEFNKFVDAGEVSHTTAGPFVWGLSLFSAVPVISLMGILIWAYIRALERRET